MLVNTLPLFFCFLGFFFFAMEWVLLINTKLPGDLEFEEDVSVVFWDMLCFAWHNFTMVCLA